jgi:hypothetical protein
MGVDELLAKQPAPWTLSDFGSVLDANGDIVYCSDIRESLGIEVGDHDYETLCVSAFNAIAALKKVIVENPVTL